MDNSPNLERFPRCPPPMVSVVIPARNAAETLPIQLSALERQDYRGRWEIVVADNNSTDETPDVVDAWKGRLPIAVIPAFKGTGVSYTRNVGIRAATGDLIAICDADDEVSESWLSTIVEASRRSDAVGGRLDYSKLNDPVAVSWRGTPLTTGPKIRGAFLPAVIGANLAVWADVCSALDGFNEEYTSGADDTEFCWRLQLAGYRLGFSTQALIHYRVRGDLRALVRQLYSYGRANPRLYRDFRKHGMPRSNTRRALLGWAWLIVHLPYLLRGRHLRGRWLGQAALRIGKVVGSIENHTIYL